jgi:hypothetical protein
MPYSLGPAKVGQSDETDVRWIFEKTTATGKVSLI